MMKTPYDPADAPALFRRVQIDPHRGGWYAPAGGGHLWPCGCLTTALIADKGRDLLAHFTATLAEWADPAKPWRPKTCAVRLVASLLDLPVDAVQGIVWGWDGRDFPYWSIGQTHGGPSFGKRLALMEAYHAYGADAFRAVFPGVQIVSTRHVASDSPLRVQDDSTTHWANFINGDWDF